MQAEVAIRQALRGDRKVIAAVLAAAFADDPILRWVLPARTSQPNRLARYFDVRFTRSVLPYGQAQLAVDDAVPCGAALWLPPQAQQKPGLHRLLSPLFLLPVLRQDIRRAASVQQAFGSVEPRTAHWYLLAIGVDPSRQGTGVGSALLGTGLRRCDATGVPAYLVSTQPGTISFYQRHGFQEAGGHRLPAGGPKFYPMWRLPRSAT